MDEGDALDEEGQKKVWQMKIKIKKKKKKPRNVKARFDMGSNKYFHYII